MQLAKNNRVTDIDHHLPADSYVIVAQADKNSYVILLVESRVKMHGFPTKQTEK